MASRQTIAPCAQDAHTQGLRSGAWPNDVIASEQLNAYHSPFIREATLYVLSPESVHGIAR
eukprot:12137727-Alexandrium_andersonii.AAC.1